MMSKRFIFTLITLIAIGLGAAAGIFLVKGYRLSGRSLKVESTGIISATSTPDGASIFVDGHLVSATNANIASLNPRSYDVRIVKEGFIPWEKKIEVKAGIISEIKATLFPAIPTIYPLTYNGAINPTLSPDGTKLAFTAPISTQSASLRQKGGVWVYTMVSSQPISFNRSSGLRQLLPSTEAVDLATANLRFSPDSKQLLVSLGEKGTATEKNFLVSSDNSTSLTDVRDVTPTIEATLKSWDEDQKTKDDARILAIKDLTIQKIASSSAQLKWSPDETKFMYRDQNISLSESQKFRNSDTPTLRYKVYDLTEGKQYELPEAKSFTWLPDSRHIILVEEGKIGVVEFDGTNNSVIYAGNFLNSFVFPWPDSSRLVILSSVPTPTAKEPNLFGINLK